MEELWTRRALEARQDGQQSVRIEYENGEGEISQRSIVPLEFYESWGHQYVRAYCYLRGERRTFALRRLEIIDGRAKASGSEPGLDPELDPTKAAAAGKTTVNPQPSNHRPAQPS